MTVSRIVKLPVPPALALSMVLALALCAAAATAAPVSHIQVRIVTGAVDLGAGSQLELRIYEAGNSTRRLPLAHGESWAHDSTRVIPLTLSDALDPRTVLRFALYYRAASVLAPPWEVIAAEVELSPGNGQPELLLGATLSGVIDRQGELASVEREAVQLICAGDADCDDHRSCNGRERCAPHTAGADARGCVKGSPVVCPVNQVCAEGRGCRGPDSIAPTEAAPSR